MTGYFLELELQQVHLCLFIHSSNFLLLVLSNIDCFFVSLQTFSTCSFPSLYQYAEVISIPKSLFFNSASPCSCCQISVLHFITLPAFKSSIHSSVLCLAPPPHSSYGVIGAKLLDYFISVTHFKVLTTHWLLTLLIIL